MARLGAPSFKGTSMRTRHRNTAKQSKRGFTGFVIVAAHLVADLVALLAAQEGLHQLNGALALGTLGCGCNLQ